MAHHAEWRTCTITFNVAMKQASEEAVDAMLSHIDSSKTDILAIGLQEVAHAETLGGAGWTWQRLITDWVTMRSPLVLLTKTYQATNQLLVFQRRSLVLQVKRIDYRFGRNTLGGLTGHKGSIGLRVAFRSRAALVFVVSHFVHDVLAYEKRIAQYQSNKVCTFPDDPTVKAVFWLGDLNFRVELESQSALNKLRTGQLADIQENHEQLRRAMTSGEAFEDFKEIPVEFQPTYRLQVGSTEYDLKRTPSWCDRILYKGASVKPVDYDSLTDVLISDHLPVMANHTLELDKVTKLECDVLFEQLPTWHSAVPIVGRFQFKRDFWNRAGSYMDWVGLFPSEILDCKTAIKWVWVATCYEQLHEAEKYYVCEFLNVPPGRYRLGYFSNYRNCLLGLSKSFDVVENL